jgi:hypothetical protein
MTVLCRWLIGGALMASVALFMVGWPSQGGGCLVLALLLGWWMDELP